jgi:tetratricopeptide (TPR) repeat protein
MKLSIIKKLLFLIITCIPLTVLSCSNTSKKITLSENTENEISLEESEIIKSITAGEKLLDEGKLEEAKENFSKAISLDKTNKDTYLRIKDKYISINKLDEAYNIVKSAISNNVDIENMKLLLKEISSKFEVINLTSSIYQYSNYALPKNANITILGDSVQIPITWDNEIVDTESLGTFKYEGFNEEYGRKVIMNITILENVYDKQIGSIEKIYSSNGKTYIDVDLIEFYTGEQAIQEALKDNNTKIFSYTEDGLTYIPNGYYIRNKYSKLTTYEISDNCSFQLLYEDFLTLGYNTSPPQNWAVTEIASFKDFKKYIELASPMDMKDIVMDDNNLLTNRGTLCWIELKNGAAHSVYRKFTP